MRDDNTSENTNGEKELDEYFENTKDIEQMLRICEELLNDEEKHKKTCMKLLEKIASSESNKEIKLILQFLANRITPSESLLNFYAEMLEWHQETKLLIEYIPAIVGDEENQIEIIFQKIKELFYNEVDYQVSFIGSMAEIKLSEKMKVKKKKNRFKKLSKKKQKKNKKKTKKKQKKKKKKTKKIFKKCCLPFFLFRRKLLK